MASGVTGSRGEASDHGFLAELKDAVNGRTALLVVAVLGLQLGFIVSYIGALHHPYPYKASIGVVAPPQASAQAVAGLNGLPNHVLDARPVADEATAVQQIKDQKLYTALVIDPAGTRDTLLVANASGPALATAVTQIVTQAEAQQGRTVVVQDVVPLAPGDAEGLSSFYLAVGWCVGGYLVASLLGISAGTRPANVPRAIIRLGSLLLFSLAAGLGGALIAGPILDALPGKIVALWGVGTMVVFAVGAVTMALECFFDVIGIGIAVLLFVILGNPSAGGVFPPPLMPPFWRTIGPWLPNGAGTDLNRSIAYFHGTDILRPLLVLSVWIVLGVGLTLLASALRRGSGRPDLPTVQSAASAQASGTTPETS
ncbi:ABC transporter permease [Streptacidiphilus melanogenes]|uniref:ABC transporter permease n=1 Tax=Streptacidiphilus melanogenes TaxID=411235 RepID=UPI0005A6D5D2|nr:ABC transporter permease [Streptacidiphilus melanogenes]